MISAEVTLPDGSTKTITGANKKEVLDKAEALASQMTPRATFKQGAAQGYTERLTDNLLGIPEAVARGGLDGFMKMATGEGIKTRGRGILGLPDGREGLSALRVGGENLLGINEGPTGQRVMDEVSRRNMVEEQAPAGQTVGEIGADIQTILTPRQGAVRGAGGLFDDVIEGGIKSASKSMGKGAYGIKSFVRDMMDTESFQLISRGLGRAAETGLEGAALAQMQNADALQSGATSFGAQLASSFGGWYARHLAAAPLKTIAGAVGTGVAAAGGKGKAAAVKAGIKAADAVETQNISDAVFGLAGTAMMLGSLYQYGKELTPGGQDRILESEESAAAKVASSMVLGLAAELMGKRSLPDGALNNFPKIADALNGIPRSALTSMLVGLREDDTGLGEKTLDITANHAWELTETQRQRISEAMRTGNLVEVAKDMYENDELFRQMIDLPHPKLAGVPEK